MSEVSKAVTVGDLPNVQNERITAVIRKKIAEIGMLKSAVAVKAGIKAKNFSAIMTNRRKITGSELLAICIVLNLKFSDFYETQDGP